MGGGKSVDCEKNMSSHYQEILKERIIARKNYKGPFCCLDMDLMLTKEEPVYKIGYNPHIREYFLESVEGYIRTIEYCPWCGSQLPKSLGDEWFDILEKEYGLDLPDIPQQRKKVPAEFKTDEWWKKRGL